MHEWFYFKSIGYSIAVLTIGDYLKLSLVWLPVTVAVLLW
jgi:hypothetical protein